jgi:hypothetical protein
MLLKESRYVSKKWKFQKMEKPVREPLDGR